MGFGGLGVWGFGGGVGRQVTLSRAGLYRRKKRAPIVFFIFIFIFILFFLAPGKKNQSPPFCRRPHKRAGLSSKSLPQEPAAPPISASLGFSLSEIWNFGQKVGK